MQQRIHASGRPARRGQAHEVEGADADGAGVLAGTSAAVFPASRFGAALRTAARAPQLMSLLFSQSRTARQPRMAQAACFRPKGCPWSMWRPSTPCSAGGTCGAGQADENASGPIGEARHDWETLPRGRRCRRCRLERLDGHIWRGGEDDGCDDDHGAGRPGDLAAGRGARRDGAARHPAGGQPRQGGRGPRRPRPRRGAHGAGRRARLRQHVRGARGDVRRGGAERRGSAERSAVPLAAALLRAGAESLEEAARADGGGE